MPVTETLPQSKELPDDKQQGKNPHTSTPDDNYRHNGHYEEQHPDPTADVDIRQRIILISSTWI